MSISGNNKSSLHAQRVKGILLDLDDTLYAYTPCNTAGQAAALAFLATKLQKKKIAKIFALARMAIKKQIPESGASHSRLLYFQKTIELLTGQSNIKLALATEKIFWRAYFAKMKLRPGIKQFLIDAKGCDVKIAIVSDFTTEIQIKKLIHLGIDHFIDVLVTSEESGRDKPAPNSFQLALKKLNLKASEVIMIGDDSKRDRAGAKQLKISFFKTTDFKDIVKIVKLG